MDKGIWGSGDSFRARDRNLGVVGKAVILDEFTRRLG